MPQTQQAARRKGVAKKTPRKRRGSAARRKRGTRAAAQDSILPQARIYAAIDETSIGRAAFLQNALLPYVGGFKVGPSFLSGRSADTVRDIFGAVPLFLDLKLHDIPNTVAQSVHRMCRYHPQMLTVHASGGLDMLRAAVDSAQEAAITMNIPRPSIVAVTVLTSLSDDDLSEVGQANPVLDQVLRLAELAKQANLDGVVAAPRDVAALRKRFGSRFLLVTPGIRKQTGGTDDHKRSMSASEAVQAGADFLVIGRPLTQAKNPAEAARKLLRELGQTV